MTVKSFLSIDKLVYLMKKKNNLCDQDGKAIAT